MEFRQLTYFLAAAQTQNFRRAADLCLVTQPALSRQIIALEKELGTVLFKRIKQHVELTDAGQVFVTYAKQALDVLQHGEQELARWQQGLSGTVLIGCNHSLATTFLPPLIATFSKQYPNIHLKVQVTYSDRIIALIEHGDVDLGCIYDPVVRSNLVTVKELFRQPLYLVTPLAHPLAQLDEQQRTLERIVAEPFIMMDKRARLRKVQDRLFLQRGHIVQPVIEIDSIGGVKELIRQGCGVTLMPPSMLWPQEANKDLAILPIADLSETFMFALAYRRAGGLSVPARQFINSVIEAIATRTD